MCRTLGTRAGVAALTLLFAATTARAAGGINLSWNDCGTAGASQKNFACNTNSGTHTIYGSAKVPVDMPQLNGESSLMYLQTSASVLSPWWWMAYQECRSRAMSVDFNFLTSTNCVDPWAGEAAGGLSYQSQYDGPNRVRIRTVGAIPGTASLSATDEIYCFRLTISHAKTVGVGSCAGCTDQACIVLLSIQLTQPTGVGDYTLTTPLNSQYVQWQTTVYGCPGITPTRATSWGAVKSLYR